MDTGYHPLPQSDEVELRVKEDAMGAYFMMFATADIVYYYDFTSMYWGYLIMTAAAVQNRPPRI